MGFQLVPSTQDQYSVIEDFSYAITFFFLLDTLLTFLTSIETYSGEEITDLPTIRRKYLCSFSFLMDVLSSLPSGLIIVTCT